MIPSKLPAVTGSLLFPRSVDELFHRFWGNAHRDVSRDTAFAPAVDVRETKDSYVFQVEIPGIDAKDVELTVTPDRLTIKGERAVETASEGETVHIFERTHGSFERSFTFPAPVATDSVTAEAKRGVLHITVTKAEKEQTRKIEIRGE